MKKWLIIIALLIFLVACNSQEQIKDNNQLQEKPSEYTIHKFERLNVECPETTVDSFLVVKDNKVVSGTLTLEENNDCHKKYKKCEGTYNPKAKSKEECWDLECHTYTKDKFNSNTEGLAMSQTKPCSFVYIEKEENTLNKTKDISWEFIY